MRTIKFVSITSMNKSTINGRLKIELKEQLKGENKKKKNDEKIAFISINKTSNCGMKRMYNELK